MQLKEAAIDTHTNIQQNAKRHAEPLGKWKMSVTMIEGMQREHITALVTCLRPPSSLNDNLHQFISMTTHISAFYKCVYETSPSIPDRPGLNRGRHPRQTGIPLPHKGHERTGPVRPISQQQDVSTGVSSWVHSELLILVGA